jgi:hypothetical protein
MSFRRERYSFCAAVVFGAVLFVSSAGAIDDQAAKCIADIKSGPSTYYTPEAAAYYASLGNYSVSGLSVDKEAAQRSFRAAVKLSIMDQSQARDAVPVLIDYFPRAIHVVQVRNASFSYSDQGTYDDCVSTYVMNAKNQVLLSSPFLDYSSLSQCENYVESTYETEVLSKQFNNAGAVVSAVFNLKITFTFYAGECALSHITGMSLGHDPSAWRQSWLASSPAPVSSAPSPSPSASQPYSYTVTGPNTVVITKTAPAVNSPSSYPDIVVKGKYRISLTTGDELTGTVESRTDSSLIFETTQGKPYAFKFSLIQNYQAIETPGPSSVSSPAAGSGNWEFLSYDELKKRAFTNPAIEVRLASGATFRGRLASINDDGLSLDVGGSTIPIAKDVIKQINAIPASSLQKNNQPPQNQGQPHGLLDSVWIKNRQTDQSSADDAMARYTKPLACPGDMVFVDLPPRGNDKPFFKLCIDKYEYPNRRGAVPRSNVAFDEARSLCAQQGKRLCTAEEWAWACSGLDGLAYPYGNSFVQDQCNNDTRQIETSGNRVNCMSPFGGYDMAGNVFEWVTTQKEKLAMMGGPYSKCQTISYAQNGEGKAQTGLRCCMSN